MFISKMPQYSPTGIFNSPLKRGTKGKGEKLRHGCLGDGHPCMLKRINLPNLTYNTFSYIGCSHTASVNFFALFAEFFSSYIHAGQKPAQLALRHETV